MMAEMMDSGDRRRSILAAAEVTFNRNGYARTTVEQVAAAAGVAKGSIYNYFHSKEELFQQVFAEVMSGATSDLSRIAGGEGSAEAKLEQVLDHWHERLERYMGIGQLVLEGWTAAAREPEGGEFAEGVRRMSDGPTELLASILAEGVGSGEFRGEISPQTGATMILALLDGLQLQVVMGFGVTVDESLLAIIKRSILAALRHGEGDGREGSQ